MKHSLAVGILIVVVVAVGIAMFGMLQPPILADEPTQLSHALFLQDRAIVADVWKLHKQPLLDAISEHDQFKTLSEITALQTTLLTVRVDVEQSKTHLSRVRALDVLKARVDSADFAGALDEFEKLSRVMP